MTDKPVRVKAGKALAQRLGAARSAMLGSVEAEALPPSADSLTLLESFVRRLQSDPDVHRTWLLLTVVTASFPQADLVLEAHRRVGHKSPRDASIWFLRTAGAVMSSRDATAEIELVTDRPLVDVDFSARSDLLTGIQRVVRSVVPRWAESRSMTLVRWADSRAFVGLTDEEAMRVGAGSRTAALQPERRIIPWGVSVFLPEVPFPGHGERLSSLARYSPNSVRAVGYDCIPAVSGELVDDAEREKFAKYLSMIKFVDLVAGISDSAVAEFEGFVAALRAQGLSGPGVVACPLPAAVPIPAARDHGPPRGRHEVLCVGTLDERKNQVAVVEAAEHLWREGLDFSLRLVGGVGRRAGAVTRLVERLQQTGRPITVAAPPVTDEVLDEAYRSARVLVFPTLHEGYGLPVAEALSYGVPVITSDFGSTREIGAGQGAVLVNPEDIGAMVAALRSLLSDDAAHAELVGLARDRPARGWDEYASELWQVFVS